MTNQHVQLTKVAGVLHGFFNLPRLYPQSHQAHVTVAEYLLQQLTRQCVRS
jgi:hypothetical protein